MWPFKERKKLEYVGCVTFQTQVMSAGKLHHIVLHKATLLMNEDNDRDVKYVWNDPDDEDGSYLKKHTMYVSCETWRHGGPFPPNLDAREPLAEMLSRMVDARLTGKVLA